MSAVPTSPSTLPVPNRRDRRTARTRQAIIDAARALIDEQGYDHTTIDQIAERADVAPRTFFRHFASKEALLFADFEERRRQMIELIEAQPAGVHPLRAALDALAEFCDVIEASEQQYMWAFKIMDDHDLLYEKSLIKAETSERIGEALAKRLGTEAGEDCRPHAWAIMALTLFGNAMRTAYGANGDGRPRACFEALVADTALCFAPVGEPGA